MNKTITNQFGAVAALIVLLSALIAPPFAAIAQAAQIDTLSVQPQNDFVLEPGKVEVFLNPGETAVRTISVTNRINRKVRFKVVTEDFVGSRDADKPVVLLGDDKSPYSFKDNLKPDTTDFSLELGQRISIPVKITVPQDAQPGGFYASVIVSNEPDKDDPDQTVSQAVTRNKIISRLGVLFFVRVNGDANESGNVQDFRLSGPSQFLLQHGPIDFEVLFNNDGSIHLVPYGNIIVTNTVGQEVANIPINAYFSLPNSLRYRTITWDKDFLLGRYTARLHLNRGYGNIVDEREISFWVIPWKILAIFFVSVFIVLSIIYFISRKFELRRKN